MLRKLLSILTLCLLCLSINAQVVYEDFEGGDELAWNAADGTYDGIVPNPATDGINTSANAGSYTKSDQHAFSLFIAELSAPMDLSVNNQFKIQIYTAAATQILLKLEGTGEAIEATKNIAVTDTWVEYSFDFSAAAGFTTINKIILFFDPGVTESGDTYLFDNLIAEPAGACAGTVPDPLIIDDFECQRNGTLGLPGFGLVNTVANPDMSGINTSAQVGEYLDQPGAFAAILYDNNNALDLSVNNNICLKLWAPVAGNLLFKLEGGVSPPAEITVPVTETMVWGEYCADFSGQAAANHNDIVFFFNAGVEPGDMDIYYYDDVTLVPPPPAEALEDFEGGPSLGWMPLNGDNTLHGTFNGAINNPDASGNNVTPTIGSYTRGTSNFSTVTAFLPDGIDLSANPQVNLQVWAPTGATNVTMQLQSPTQGVVSVDQDISATETWIDLNFSFSDFDNVTDFERINLLFSPGNANTDTYFFDNLAQGESTVDPCEGVATDPQVLDDFECQRNAPITTGADRIQVINNPDVTVANSSLQVAEYTDPNDQFSAIVYQLSDTTDFSLFNQLSIQIWSPKLVPLLFKLEGGPNPPIEVFTDVTATNEWVRYEVDFSNAADMGFERLAIFTNAGQDPGGEDIYYIDNIELRRAPFDGCVSNYEVPEFTVDNFRYFANGSFEDNAFIVQANPGPDAVNDSPTVGTFEEANDGAEFAGMFADLDAPIALPTDNKTMTMKIWMPVAGDVVMKLEDGVDGAPNVGDVFATYDTPMAWQELSFDFSATPDDARYNRLTLIPNFGVIPMENLTHYFDDVSVAGASCGVVGIFTPIQVASMRVMPNPAKDYLTVENIGQASFFQIVNMMGQPLKTLQVAGQMELVEMDLLGLPAGVYVLTAYNNNGALVANARFIKD